jgi:hypothetical protein
VASFVLYRSLERLAGALDRAGSPIRGALRPGRGDAEVRGVLRSAGLVAPYQLADLYGWADGTRGAPGVGPDLVRLVRFLSLEEALAVYRSGPPLTAPERREWWPVFMAGDGDGDGDGDRVSVQCGLGVGRGTVWWSRRGQPEALFDSLAEAVDAACWCVEAGWWRPDADGRLLDRRAEGAIDRRAGR